MYGNPSLKSAITETLQSIMNTGSGNAAIAEESLKALEVTETYGLCLVELAVSGGVDASIRQMSAVLLKQYVRRHWIRAEEDFVPPETPPNVKESIRRTLPVGLGDSDRKVRNVVAIAISEIARFDWPEEWPDLFQLLMRSLASSTHLVQEGPIVHGVLRVLREISLEVTHTHFPKVAPVILPALVEILHKGEEFSPKTKSRVVYVLHTLFTVAVSARGVDKTLAGDYLLPYLTPALDDLVNTLQNDNPMESNTGLKKEIIKFLGDVLTDFPKWSAPHRDQILAVVWSLLTRTVSGYVHAHILKSEEEDEEEDAIDSDGNTIGVTGLVYSLIDFVDKLATSSHSKAAVRTSLDEMVYYLMQLSQLTGCQCLEYSEDLDAFIEEEDDDPLTCTVRIAVGDLMFNLLHAFRHKFTSALCNACGRMLTEASQLRESSSRNSKYWWKLHEAVLSALSKSHTEIIEGVEAGKLQFDVAAFVEGVVLPNMGINEFPFLQSAALQCASHYVTTLATEVVGNFLQATVSALSPSLPANIRICAAKSLLQYIDMVKSKQAPILHPHLVSIIDGLLDLSSHGEQAFGVALQTLCPVLSINQELTAQEEPKLGPFLLSAFLNFSSSPAGLMECEDMFRILTANPHCRVVFHERVLPLLLSMIEGDGKEEGRAANGLELLSILVRHSPVPLSDALMLQAFPLVVHTTLSSEDASCVQNGADCLRAFVSAAPNQVAHWRDNRGNSGLVYILQVVSRLLSPKSPHSYALGVGRLISVLLSKTWSDLGENIDLLLRAVLGKLSTASNATMSVKQSLMMVFAQLCLHHLEEVLEFLSTVPDITGEAALGNVLKSWCDTQHEFFGKYDVKVSILALCALVQHTVKSNDVRLQEILTTGDPVNPEIATGVRTRRQQKAEPVEFKQIPVIVKMYKLLINELHRQIEEREATDTDESTDNEDGEKGDEDDEEHIIRTVVDALDEEEYLEELGADDPDAAGDPVNQIDLYEYLCNFLMGLSRQPFYHLFAQHHNDMERAVLRGIGVESV